MDLICVSSLTRTKLVSDIVAITATTTCFGINVVTGTKIIGTFGTRINVANDYFVTTTATTDTKVEAAVPSSGPGPGRGRRLGPEGT